MTFKAVPSTPASRCLGHGLCEVLKVKGRAECASQGHATKRCGRRSVADWCLASALFLVSAARAVVLVEALLGNAVKCERRNGALQTRGGKTPGAVGAAPAGKCFVLNPDYASIHWLCADLDFDGRMDFRRRRGAGIHMTTRARNVARALVGDNLARNRGGAK